MIFESRIKFSLNFGKDIAHQKQSVSIAWNAPVVNSQPEIRDEGSCHSSQCSLRIVRGLAACMCFHCSSQRKRKFRKEICYAADWSRGGAALRLRSGKGINRVNLTV